MRLLANENMAASVVKGLRAAGHDVLSAKESIAGANDDAVLKRAISETRVLLTFDKDFGELAFRSELPASCGVILVRFIPKGRAGDRRTNHQSPSRPRRLGRRVLGSGRSRYTQAAVADAAVTQYMTR